MLDSALRWKWNSVRCIISASVICLGKPKMCPAPDIRENGFIAGRHCRRVKKFASQYFQRRFTFEGQQHDLYRLGETARYGCKDGFVIRGTRERICGADGGWEGHAPECVPVGTKASDDDEEETTENYGAGSESENSPLQQRPAKPPPTEGAISSTTTTATRRLVAKPTTREPQDHDDDPVAEEDKYEEEEVEAEDSAAAVGESEPEYYNDVDDSGGGGPRPLRQEDQETNSQIFPGGQESAAPKNAQTLSSLLLASCLLHTARA